MKRNIIFYIIIVFFCFTNFLAHFIQKKQIEEKDMQIAYLQSKLAEKIKAEEDMNNQFAQLYSITQKAIHEASECKKWRSL